MEINRLTVGILSTNCYIIITKSNSAIVIDPGADADTILKFLEEKQATLKAILFTHGHFDHISATNTLNQGVNVPTYIHADDNELLLDPAKSMSAFFTDFKGFTPFSADVLLKDADVVTVDEVTFTLLHTPGHTKGSSVFLVEDLMFAGDTLFCGGIGRTDLYGGDMNTMTVSLAKLAALEGDYTVLSGHGEATRLSHERRTNPYMGTNYDDIF